MAINWEAVGALSELVGAIAVVATLIYLAVQVRQNNRLLSSSSRQALITNDLASLKANIDQAGSFVRYVQNQPLSPEDQLRLSFMFAEEVDLLLKSSPAVDTYARMSSWVNQP